MADKFKRRFTVELEINPKLAEKQAGNVLKNLGAIFSDFQKKTEKLTYFQELVDYLQQIDSELTRLKKIHGASSVNKAFGGLGKSIQQQLQEGFMVNGQDFSKFDVLRRKIDEVVQSGGKTKDLLPIANEINDFFDLLGRADMKIDLSQLAGDVKIQAEYIHDTLNEVIKSFNLVKRNVTVGLGNDVASKIKLNLDKYKALVDELETAGVDGARKKEIFNQLEAIQQEVSELGNLSKNMREDFDAVFEDYAYDEIEMPEAIEQLIKILKIEIPDAINTAQNSVENFSDAAVSNIKSAITAIRDTIAELNKVDLNGERLYQERSVQMTSSGKFVAIDDIDGGVSTEKIVAMMLSNLSDDFVTALHSHPIIEAANGETFIENFFSGSQGDIRSALNNMKMGYQATGLVAGDIIHILDTSKISIQEMEQVLKNLQIAERQLAKEIPELFQLNDQGDIVGYRQMQSAEDAQKMSSIMKNILAQAFKNAGINFNDVYKQYNTNDVDQSDELARHLLTLSNSADKATDPIQRLQAIIEKFSHDDNRMNAALADFKNGLISAVEAFNRSVTDSLKISQADMDAVKNLKWSFGEGIGFGDGTGTSSGSETSESIDTSALQQTISQEADKIIRKLNETLKVEVVKNGESNKETGDATKTDLTTLEASIKGELQTLSGKLDSVLKVNIENDKSQDIIQAIKDTKQVIDTIGSDVGTLVTELNKTKSADAEFVKQAEIDVMKQNLTALFKQVVELNNRTDVNGNPQRQEISAQFMSDGTISTAYGERGAVPWDRIVAQLVKNLSSNLIMDLHSHPLHFNKDNIYKYANDHFSGSHGDLAAWQTSKRFGAQMAGMITGNILRTFNVSALNNNQYKKFVENLSKIEQKYAKDPVYTQYMGVKDDGSTYYKTQDDLAGRHMVTKVFEEIMYEALKQTGLSVDKINQEIFHKYDLTDDAQLTQLATMLVQLNNAAHASISPVQRLSDILQSLRVDTSSSAATTALLGFEKGEMSAADVINDLAPIQYHITDELVNAVNTIDSNNKPSTVETTLNSILDVLSTINKSVNSLQASIKPDANKELSSVIDDILKIQHGDKLDNSGLGIKSIYDENNISEYQVDNVLKLAKDAVGEAMSKILLSDGMDLGISEVNDLVLSFKTALSYVDDAAKQVARYDKIDGLHIKTNINGTAQTAEKFVIDLKKTLLNVDDVINPLLGMLNNTRSKIQAAENAYDIGTIRTNQTSTNYDSTDYHSNVLGVNDEISALERLKGALNNIHAAIDTKTELFDNERRTVEYAVSSEQQDLNNLKDTIGQVETAVYNKTITFVDEKNTVESVVSQEIDKLEELRKKLVDVKDAVSQLYNGLGVTNQLDVNADTQPDVTNETDNIKQQAEAYDRLIRSVKDLIDLKEKAKNDDIFLMPKYHEGVLQRDTYYSSSDIKNNRATKASIRRSLDRYEVFKQSGNENFAKASLNELVSLVATYKNVDDARSVFKKKELDIWDEVINRINAAKEAQTAYEKYQARNGYVFRSAAELGSAQDKSTTYGDLFNFDKLIDAGDLDAVVDYLVKKFQIKIQDTQIDHDQQKIATDTYRDTTQSDISNQIAALSQVEKVIKDQTDAFNNEKSVVDAVVTSEIQQLEQLRLKILEVRDVVDAKTRAFEEEYVTVDGVVAAEMVQLHGLLDLLQQVAVQIGIINDAFNATGGSSIASGGTVTVVHAMEKEYALDTTLITTNGILADILVALNNNEQTATLVNSLNAVMSRVESALQAMKDAANGIEQHQKAQKSDTKVAMARIQDPDQLRNMIGLAKDSVNAFDADIEIESYQAMADGLVKFEGAFKNVHGLWEGFTVAVNEHNEAVDLAVKKHSAFANKLNKEREEANKTTYNKEETETRAQRHLDEYAAQGKKATVEFKDSGRYTITILEEIDGLTKQIFQTFDENDAMIERTTVTMSNNQRDKLENLRKKLIDDGIDKGFLSVTDKEYDEYLKATEVLKKLNQDNAEKDELTDDDIQNWKQQIELVQKLGDEVEKLIQKRKDAADLKLFKSDKDKKLSQFDLDKATLEKDGPIDTDKYDISAARSAIENATNQDELAIAVNAWTTIKNEIKQAAVEAKKLSQNNNLAFNTKQLQTYAKDVDKIMRNLDFGINDKDKNEEQISIVEAYRKIVEQIAILKDSDEELTVQQISHINDLIDAFKRETAAYTNKVKAQKDAEAKAKAPQEKFKADHDAQLDAFDKYEKSLEGAGYLTTELTNKIEDLKNKLVNIDSADGLSGWQKEFKELAHEIDVAKAKWTGVKNVDKTAYKKQADDAMKGLGFGRDDDDLSDAQRKIVEAYDAVIAAVNEYELNVRNGNKAEIDGIKATVKALKEKTDAYRKDNDIANVNTKNFGATVARREERRHSKLTGYVTNYADSQEFAKKLVEYNAKYKKFTDLQKEMANAKFVTNEQIASFERLRDEVAESGKELTKLINASEKLKNNAWDYDDIGPDFEDSSNGKENALTEYINNLEDFEVESIEFKDNFNKCIAIVKDGDGAFKKITATVDVFGRRIVSNIDDAGEAVSNLGKFIDLVKVKSKQIFAYLISMVGIEELFQQVRQGITYVKEIDDALTELKKVTNETDKSYDRFLQKMSSTASVVGSTVAELTKSAADWARLGYSMEDAGKLAATTTKLLNVSEFENIDDATSALVSSLQAFLEDGQDIGKRAEEIVDILNNIGKYIA